MDMTVEVTSPDVSPRAARTARSLAGKVTSDGGIVGYRGLTEVLRDSSDGALPPKSSHSRVGENFACTRRSSAVRRGQHTERAPSKVRREIGVISPGQHRRPAISPRSRAWISTLGFYGMGRRERKQRVRAPPGRGALGLARQGRGHLLRGHARRLRSRGLITVRSCSSWTSPPPASIPRAAA